MSSRYKEGINLDVPVMFGGHPNIVGTFSPRQTAGFAHGSITSGAFSLGDEDFQSIVDSSASGGFLMAFNAADSDNTYSGSSVQVPAVQALVCIKI